jgi:hypothetical protein
MMAFGTFHTRKLQWNKTDRGWPILAVGEAKRPAGFPRRASHKFGLNRVCHPVTM